MGTHTIQQLAAERQRLLTTIEETQHQIDRIDAQILAATRPGDKLTDPDGNTLFTVRAPHRRFNAKRAAETLTEQQLAAISTPAPQAALAKTVLPEPLYNLCCTLTEPTIVKANQ